MFDISILHERFLDHAVALKGYSPATIREMKRSFRAFVDHSAIEDVRTWNFPTLEDWVIHNKTHSKWSAKTIHNYLGYLSLFADWCIRRKYIETNPVSQIDRPKLPHREPEYLSEAQCEALLDWTRCMKFSYTYEKPRAVAIIATFISTGLRKSELVNLKIDDVDMDSMCVRVKEGKGRKDRTIPFHPSLARILETYLKERARLNRQTPYFFAAMRGNQKMGDKVIQRLVDRIREASGIYFYPHLLRHTYITRMLENGFHIREVQKLAGHADIKTTAGYAAVSMMRIKEQVRIKGLAV